MAATPCALGIDRPIVIPAAASRDEPVLLAFYSGGNTDPQGKGIAIVGKDDAPVPFGIIHHDPVAQTWLIVEPGDRTDLTLRYGRTPQPDAKHRDDLQPSLLLRTYPLKSDAITTADALLEQTKGAAPLGVMTVDQISIAYHPFGPNVRYISVFDGLLRVGERWRGKVFAVNDDVAFVSIDGKWLIEQPQPRVSLNSREIGNSATALDLEPGLHRIRYVHAQKDGQSLAMLGLMQGDRAVPVPSSFFVHDRLATLGPARQADAVGFDAKQVDQIAYNEQVFTRWRLRPIVPLTKGGKHRFDFGDGSMQTIADAAVTSVDHVFLGSPADLGSSAVRLDMLQGDDKVVGSATSTIRPTPALKPASVEDEAILDAYAAAINGCDYRRTPRPTLTALYDLLWYQERPARVAPLAEVLVTKFGKGATNDAALWQIKYALATSLVRDQPQRAGDLYRELAGEKIGDATWDSSCAAASCLDVMIFSLGKGAEAANLAPRMAAGRPPRERSLILARTGDVFRLAGDHDHALEAYQRARRAAIGEMSERQAAVVERAWREAAIDHMLHHRFTAMRDALMQWEADFPTAKIGGDLPLFTARYFQAVGDDRRAVAELQSLIQINPLHPGRPEIVYRLGQSLHRLGKLEEAAKWFGELREKYPNSPFAEGLTKP